MKDRESKAGMYPERSWRLVPLVLMFFSLCAVSFYLGGIYFTEKEKLKLVENETSQPFLAAKCAVASVKTVAFDECSFQYQDYTPCMDPKRWKRYDRHRLAFRERHCPPLSERVECLIPPPKGYKIPMSWPKSREECWYRNVPYDWINNVKSNQNWLRKEGEKFIFPGGGTMFPRGVNEYLDLMEELIPGMKDGSVRTALDTGCGVASWGGYLLDRGILTMSLAPRDNHEAQVQFALERGIPAMLGIISTQRLPYPSSAFDMAHCSRCLIPWTEFGGIYLMEIDRVLRPGGFWVISGPPVNYENRWRGWNSTIEEQKANFDSLQNLLTSLCYKLHSTKDDIAVWQKPIDNNCYGSRKETAYPPICDDSIEPDAAWYVPLRPCIAAANPNFKKLGVGLTPRWPDRLNVVPDRIRTVSGGNSNSFKKDAAKWVKRVKYYKTLLPELGSDKIRNVMDMNTIYGGLAAALIKDPVWVMNVVSSYGINSLHLVYDRGLIGTYNDWCEAFSTYPRTYDLLHLDGLFTAEGHRCEMKFVLLEMDRMLRPNGFVIIRESPYVVDSAFNLASVMRWDCRKSGTEDSQNEKEKVLICKKKFWQSSTL
ncbi:probable methyltransferase PMT20 [Cryptomeria japonica]|uniref:probable methyltransferase PMT20 n=1 Tax=Cryptomeria japonica TaxID=3369 RepID=UPI0027DAA879|nr:probable methyltransferase PMT20 [Cryptomeria japonica]XP_057825611.2 probable methyltransferase PMT20 [Cryptomeria japonica]XP_057825612.2 probable methyltransferase PMT20 [Cryptomeria japonica]